MRVVLVDDEYYAMEGLRRKLEGIEALEVVGMYDDSTAFLRELKHTRPDIVFLDVEMPRMNGFEVLAEMLEDPLLSHLLHSGKWGGVCCVPHVKDNLGF